MCFHCHYLVTSVTLMPSVPIGVINELACHDGIGTQIDGNF